MKIMTWNCNGALWKKFALLEAYDADILVIQECEDPAQSRHNSYREWAQNYLWLGKNKNRGLGIFWKNGIDVAALDTPDHGLQYFIHCRVEKRFDLLAIWSQNQDEYRYIELIWLYLTLNQNHLKSSIILGDWNSNTIWDYERAIASHSDVVEFLKQLGSRSLYHDFYHEAHGHETKPTFFMYRKAEKPYHIDYIFAPETIIPKDAEFWMGDMDYWLAHSDHVPLSITF